MVTEKQTKAAKKAATKARPVKKPAAKATAVKKAAAESTPASKTPAKKSAKAAPSKTAASKRAAEAEARRGAQTVGSAAPGAGPFAVLRHILRRHEQDLVVVHDVAGHYYLDTRTLGPNKKPLFFGAAREGKAYTSFYLMPVYTDPALLDGMSPALKKRMQGKSCFNFKAPEPELLDELGRLTARCFDHWKKSGRI